MQYMKQVETDALSRFTCTTMLTQDPLEIRCRRFSPTIHSKLLVSQPLQGYEEEQRAEKGFVSSLVRHNHGDRLYNVVQCCFTSLLSLIALM